MLRTYNPSALSWQEKTMSFMRENREEACMDRLFEFPETGLFSSPMADEEHQWYLLSYYREESNHEPNGDLLREMVLCSAKFEAAFLSSAEEELVHRMMKQGGREKLDENAEVGAVESLLKRLWCTFHYDEKNDTAFLVLEEPVLLELLNIENSLLYFQVKLEMFALRAMTLRYLYLYGYVFASLPARLFADDLNRKNIQTSRHLIERLLKATYVYRYTKQGELLLLHPGLYDDSFIMDPSFESDMSLIVIDEQTMQGDFREILPEEIASSQLMQGILSRTLQPEYNPYEVNEDLRIMVKQGASLEAMKEVLYPKLAVAPDHNIEAALSRLQLETVPWFGKTKAYVN